MRVRNCKNCGKLFNYIQGLPICPTCKEEAEKQFTEVKDYIREHNDCTVQSVAEACNVSEGQIRQWVREERLEFKQGEHSGIVCKTCGTPISTGSYCENCKRNLVNGLQASITKKQEPIKQVQKPDVKNQMRFINKDIKY